MGLDVFGRPAKPDVLSGQSASLRDALGLNGSPVAVLISDEPPPGVRQRRRLTACVMIGMARGGKACYSSGNGMLCGGGANLGMGESPIRNLDDFLVRKEKLFKSKEASRRLLDDIEKRAPRRGRFLTFSPLENAAFTPDVVVFVGTPEVASRIVFLNAYETGDVEAMHGEPLCSGAIALPVSTGRIGISFLDMACRRFGRYRPEEMVIGVPYHRLQHIVDAIEHSSAGRAKPSVVLKAAEMWLRGNVAD